MKFRHFLIQNNFTYIRIIVKEGWADKETGKKDIGVVAQEVEEILPEIVQTRSNGYKAVDYQKLTALLIESVKEQQVIINDLKTRIETLESKLTSIQNMKMIIGLKTFQ